MIGRNRADRNDAQNYNRDSSREAGYENRFGSAGMKGPRRYSNESMQPRRPLQDEYSSFEGTTNRPYYGGEEGEFPFGGSIPERNRSASFNADERASRGRWTAGEHFGKGPKGYQRSDERIREEVCEMLTEHGDLDASNVDVHVENAIVYLRGSVEDRRSKRIAEDVAEQASGVKDVRNELSLGEESHFSAKESRSSKSKSSSQRTLRQ